MQTGDVREEDFDVIDGCISRCEALSEMYATWSISQ